MPKFHSTDRCHRRDTKARRFSEVSATAKVLTALILAPILSLVLLSPEATAQSFNQSMKQLFGQSSQQSYPPERTLSVSGEGIMSIPTTLSQVNLGIVVEAPTAQAAQQQAATQSTAVVEWLRSQNVEKLETAGISLSPRYDYSNDRQTLRGYEASNRIQFRVPTEQAGPVMDEAVNVGATRIDGVSFVAEDDAISAARSQALELAVQDAQQQADAVLAALGLSRQEVVNISVGSLSAPPPRPVMMQERALANSAPASTPVIGQEQDINARVTLYIRY